jgi:predicted nucleic acid-binding protein
VTLVLDASVAAAAILRDETTEAAQAVLQRTIGEATYVPSLWRLEIANVLRNAVRKGRCSTDFADAALIDLAAFPIVVDGETDARAWSDTLALSRGEDLTPYDAAYLELAIRRQATLASYDRDLIAAARRRGLAILTN